MTNHRIRHTPGTWQIQRPLIDREPEANNHGYYVIYASEGDIHNRTRDIAYSLITSIYEDAAMPADIRECEANARLIAAAPALFSLAQTFRAACMEHISLLNDELKEEWCDVEDIDARIGHWNALLNECNEVIAKTQFTLPKSRLARRKQASR